MSTDRAACGCQVQVVAANRKERRRLRRDGSAATEIAAHADTCPLAGRYTSPGYQGAGRIRSPWR